MCVLWGEIKRKRRRDGWIYRYIWGREGRRFPVVNALISMKMLASGPI